jgi:hypothetical protein
MFEQQDYTNESFVLLLCLVLGVVVAAVLAPKGEYFFMNFAFYWIPQIVVVGILVPFSSRPAVVSGAAIILSVYLVVYGIWLTLTKTDDAGLAWLGYLFSLPGGAIGAEVGANFIKKNNFQRAMVVGAFAAASTTFGLVANQLIICNTVMYCGF